MDENFKYFSASFDFSLQKRPYFKENFDLFLELSAENGDRIAGFLFEPIQGEAGVCGL